MITRHTHAGITWVDLESPSRHELQEIVAEFDIDNRIQEEVIFPSPYPLVVETDKYVYMVLHFPITDAEGIAHVQEIDFIVGKEFLITCRYETITTVHNLHKAFEAEELLGLGKSKSNAGELVERVLRQLYSSTSEEIDEYGRLLEGIEDDIFSGKERETVLNISLVGRVLLRFGTTLERHREPLSEFLSLLSRPSLFGASYAKHAAHIEAEHQHAVTLVVAYRAVAAELRNTNDSLLSTAQNDIIQRLTTITFAAVPLTIIAALFGMNINNMPFIHHPNAFYIVLGLMTGILILLVGYFKFKRWL